MPEADRPTPAIMQLEVVNRNEFTINDFFDGIPISFPPGEMVTVTPDMALHCFGYPGEMRDRAVHMAKRYGWSGRDYLRPEGPGDNEPRYATLAGKIEINPVYFDLVRRDRSAPIPADDGREPDQPPEPTGDGPSEGTRVGRRKATRRAPPARVSGDRRAAPGNQRSSRAR